MTRDADLKAKVRARMERTGESYTAARETLLAEPSRARARDSDRDSNRDNRDTGPTPGPDPPAEKAIRSFFDGDRLRSIPRRRRPRAAVLMHLLTRFERGRNYAEREVNDILRTAQAGG